MRVLILGAGFGGLEVATRLSETLGDKVAVTLIDQSDSFVFGFSKLDAMFGLQTETPIRVPYSAISKPGVDFRQERIISIDPEAKCACTDQGVYFADVLVVALGADLDPSATPGLVEYGHDFYSVLGAEQVRDVLANFKGGDVVVALCTPHYKCPPAPSECAMLLHDYLDKRGLREISTITYVSPNGSPLPVTEEVGAAILNELTTRGIDFVPNTPIAGFSEREVHLEDGRDLPADLILAIPVHVAPPVVLKSGLAENGWIPTDKYTLQTRFPDVFAFGDVASVGVPRAGVFSERQASVVAEQIIRKFQAETSEARYDGKGTCYIEFGHGTVGRVDVDFLTGPTRTAEIMMPSVELRQEKKDFAKSRRSRWFGLDY
ncbi:MAG: NAD(P)/FAD-dependent oxidoreductase [Thermomicrobiales bacterium]